MVEKGRSLNPFRSPRSGHRVGRAGAIQGSSMGRAVHVAVVRLVTDTRHPGSYGRPQG